jgi:hypothetical protein
LKFRAHGQGLFVLALLAVFISTAGAKPVAAEKLFGLTDRPAVGAFLCGVMLRENISSGSKYAFAALTWQGGPVFQSRALMDGFTMSAAGPAAKPPHWLKLTRSGDIFSGNNSADGTHWLATGSVTNTLNKNLLAGFAVTAHNNSVLNATLFDSVTISARAKNKT